MFSYYVRPHLSIWIFGCFSFLLMIDNTAVHFDRWTEHDMGQTKPGEGLGQHCQNRVLSIRTAMKIDVPTSTYLPLSLPVNQYCQILLLRLTLHFVREIFEWCLPSCFLAKNPCNPDTSLFPLSLLHQRKSGTAHWRSQGSINCRDKAGAVVSIPCWPESRYLTLCCLNAAGNHIPLWKLDAY